MEDKAAQAKKGRFGLSAAGDVDQVASFLSLRSLEMVLGVVCSKWALLFFLT